MHYKITIPQPCSENWEFMTATEKGRFCASCTKEVLDFTKMNDAELLLHVQSGSKLCGRFRSSQLDKTYLPARTTYHFARVPVLVGLGSLFALTAPNDLQAQAKPQNGIQLEQGSGATADDVDEIIVEKKSVEADSILRISGSVFDDTGEALFGATMRIKGTNFGTITDINGYFSIEIDIDSISLPLSVEVSYTGYRTQIIEGISDFSKEMNVVMDTMGCVISGDLVIVKMNFFQRAKWKIKHTWNRFRGR